MTLEEAFTGRKPSVSHLHVYGSDAHVHISDTKLTKFESKNMKCKFLGYSRYSKAYQLWNPQTNRLSFLEISIFQSHNIP